MKRNFNPNLEDLLIELMGVHGVVTALQTVYAGGDDPMLTANTLCDYLNGVSTHIERIINDGYRIIEEQRREPR